MPPASPGIRPERHAPGADLAARGAPLEPPRADDQREQPLAPEKRPGYQPTSDQVEIVRVIGVALAAVAAISAIPAVLDVVAHLRTETSLGVTRWAYLVLMLAMLQCAYAAYVYQLPDWSTVWVVTIATLVMATGYAMMLGLTFISNGDAWAVRSLDLGDVIRGGRASLWCFLMLCLTSMVSYFSGRISVRWRDELRSAATGGNG